MGLAGAKRTTLTLSNGNEYTAQSGRPGGRRSGNPPLTNTDNYSTTVATAKENAIANGGSDPGYYGECAEINAINAALMAGETRESMSGATMDTRFNRDREESENQTAANEGDPAEACDCCKEVLEEYGITDVNDGCGNK